MFYERRALNRKKFAELDDAIKDISDTLVDLQNQVTTKKLSVVNGSENFIVDPGSTTNKFSVSNNVKTEIQTDLEIQTQGE